MKEEKSNVNIIEASELQPHSSIELKKTSKGVNLRVKVYSCDTQEQVEHAMDMATNTFDEILKKYKQKEK